MLLYCKTKTKGDYTKMNISIINPTWHEFPSQADRTIEQVLEIIEDATANGFIFKVENHKIYFKEMT